MVLFIIPIHCNAFKELFKISHTYANKHSLYAVLHTVGQCQRRPSSLSTWVWRILNATTTAHLIFFRWGAWKSLKARYPWYLLQAWLCSIPSQWWIPINFIKKNFLLSQVLRTEVEVTNSSRCLALCNIVLDYIGNKKQWQRTITAWTENNILFLLCSSVIPLNESASETLNNFQGKVTFKIQNLWKNIKMLRCISKL